MTAAGFCAPRFLVVMTARLFAAALGCLVAIIAIVLFVGAPDIFPVFPLALNPDGSTDLGSQPVEQEGPIKGSQVQSRVHMSSTLCACAFGPS